MGAHLCVTTVERTARRPSSRRGGCTRRRTRRPKLVARRQVARSRGRDQRAEAVLSAAGYTGTVLVDGITVTVTARAGVRYAFPSPGFPPSVSGSASASARAGVDGTERG